MSRLWGQMCLMLPKYNFVMAINARGSSSQPMLDIFNETILPALKGNVDVVDNQNQLDEFVKSRKVELKTSSFVSNMKQEIDGKEGIACNNEFGVESFKLTFIVDVVKFEAVRNGHHFECLYGHNKLIREQENIVDLFPPYYDSISLLKNELINYHNQILMVNTYGKMKVHYYFQY